MAFQCYFSLAPTAGPWDPLTPGRPLFPCMPRGPGVPGGPSMPGWPRLPSDPLLPGSPGTPTLMENKAPDHIRSITLSVVYSTSKG